MVAHRIARKLLAGGMGIAVALLPFQPVGSADVSTVDICDVQRVIAQLANGPCADNPADVNGDGQVDILDLQRVLHLAAKGEEKEPELDAHPLDPTHALLAKTVRSSSQTQLGPAWLMPADSWLPRYYWPYESFTEWYDPPILEEGPPAFPVIERGPPVFIASC